MNANLSSLVIVLMSLVIVLMSLVIVLMSLQYFTFVPILLHFSTSHLYLFYYTSVLLTVVNTVVKTVDTLQAGSDSR